MKPIFAQTTKVGDFICLREVAAAMGYIPRNKDCVAVLVTATEIIELTDADLWEWFGGVEDEEDPSATTS